MDRQSRIYVSGHTGLVGKALCSLLRENGFSNLILKSHGELDLVNQNAVHDFFESEKPEYVFHVAGKVGGILANSEFPADFIYQNIMMQTNVIHLSHLFQVKKLVFFGSSCIYPKLAPQPIREEYLLGSSLEPTNEPYAIAKIAGIRMCQAYNRQYGSDFISMMPTNLYGPGDNFDLDSSHVLPALIRKFHEAKIRSEPNVVLWGTGKPLREFLYVDDLVKAAMTLMLHYDSCDIINVGSGHEISIGNLAFLIKEVVGFSGEVFFDQTKPDGTPRKLLDSSRIFKMGWKPEVDLGEGILRTYDSFLAMSAD